MRKKYNNELKEFLHDNFEVNKSDLSPIHSKEGIILTDGSYVFKAITFLKERDRLLKNYLNSINPKSERIETHLSLIDTKQTILHTYFQLKALSSSVKKYEPTKMLDFDVFLSENLVIIKTPYVEISRYTGNHEGEIITLLKELKEMRWICFDFKPKNLKLTRSTNNLLLIDIGYFYVPYSENLFKTMSRRAFISMKFACDPNVKHFLREANKDESFSYFKDRYKYKDEFDDFYKRVVKDD